MADRINNQFPVQIFVYQLKISEIGFLLTVSLCKDYFDARIVKKILTTYHAYFLISCLRATRGRCWSTSPDHSTQKNTF